MALPPQFSVCHRSSTRRSTRRSLPPCDRQLSPLQSAPHAAPSLGSPWSGGPRVSARPIREEVGASPLVRLEKAVRGRLSGHQSRQEDIYSLALCRASARGCWLRSRYPLSYRPSFASPARSTVASFASPRSTEYCCYGIRLYCCAICIELLLRPVVLSRAVTASAAAAGYAYCRAARRAPSLAAPATPSPVCPLGRCEVRPCVHEIDLWHSRVRCASGCSLSKAHSVIGPAKPVCCCISKF
jgi:hypothetical protein